MPPIALRNNGITTAEIAKQIGLSRSYVSAICLGKRWTHINAKAAEFTRRGSQKLTEREVLEIISLRNQGLTLKKIAEKFGVTDSAIFLICSGKNWEHLGTRAEFVRHSKLTEADAIEIINLRNQGVTQKETAKKLRSGPKHHLANFLRKDMETSISANHELIYPIAAPTWGATAPLSD